MQWKKKGLQQFFSLLPKMESHYCRASSSKLYLEPIWQSKSALYKEYAKYCKVSDLQILSVKVFYEEFDNNNLSLFHPKKNQCDLCIWYKCVNTSEEAYTSHIQSKIRAREEKQVDKDHAEHVYTLDLEAILLSPILKASTLYCKKKLIVQNIFVKVFYKGDNLFFFFETTSAFIWLNVTVYYQFIFIFFFITFVNFIVYFVVVRFPFTSIQTIRCIL